MSLKFVFVLSLIFTVFEHFSSSKVSSLFSAAENRQPSINVTVSGDLKTNQGLNVLLTSLKDNENAPDCSSGSWNSSSNCTEFSQVYFGINSTYINKEKETVLPPHEDSASVAARFTNADNVSLHGHPVRTTTNGKNIEKNIIMSYVVAQPREIKNFPLNSTKYTNMAEIRSTRESPRMRRARSKTRSVSKTLVKEGFAATKPATRRPKQNGKSRKKRHWPRSGTAIESPRHRRIRVTKKFPAEFESVLKRVFPDNFVTTVRNNNYYRSGNKNQLSLDLNIPDGACAEYKNCNSSNRRQKVKKPAVASFDEKPFYFRAASETTGATKAFFMKIITKIETEMVTETYDGTAPAGADIFTIDFYQTKTGTEQTGTEQTGTEQSGTEQTGTEQTGTEQSGTEQTGTGQTGTEQTGTEQTEIEQTGIEQTGTSQQSLLLGAGAETEESKQKGPEVNYHYHFFQFGGSALSTPSGKDIITE